MSDAREPVGAAHPARPDDASNDAGAVASSWWRRHATLIDLAILIAASCAVYANTLANHFAFDDEIQVVQNPYIRRLASLPALFTMPTWPGSVYRPLVLATYSLTYAAVGLEPWLYHAMNVAMHAAVVALAYLILSRLVGRAIAFVAALLFAVHPIHVDAVAGVANRTELVSALLGLLTVWLVLRRDAVRNGAPVLHIDARDAGRLGGIAFVFLLALLSKESALTSLLLVPLCLWMGAPARGWPSWAELRGRYLPPLAAMVVGFSICVAMRLVVLGELVPDPKAPALDNPLAEVGAMERVARAIVLLGRYLSAIVLPIHLSPDYSLGTTGMGVPLLSPESIVDLLLLAVVVLTIALGWRADRRLSFFGLWFLAAFALTANVLHPMPTVFGERLAYLPSLGACGLAAWLVVRLPTVPKAAVLSIAVAILAMRTWTYGSAWRDNDTLFHYAMSVEPGSARVQLGYGEALVRNGALSAARRQFSETIAQNPLYADPHYGLALADLHEGRREEAIERLENALELAPAHLPSLILLGRVKLRGGEFDAAGRLFVKVLNIDNDHFEARLGVLAATLERGNLTQAVTMRDQLRAIDPTSPELIAVSRELDQQLAAQSGGAAQTPSAELAPAG